MISKENLIMTLTMEQGRNRETQVQPPVNVWAYYFGLNFSALPTIQVVRFMQPAPQAYVAHPVVEHDHNWTIELPDVTARRPAIIRLEKKGTNRYDLWVYFGGSAEYDHCEWLLKTIANPLHTTGRKWLMI